MLLITCYFNMPPTDTKSTDPALNELIEKAIDGNVPACHDLANKVSLRLRTYIYRSTLDDNVTDDVLQDTLIIFIKKIGTLKEPSAFWSWLFRIASNSIIDYYRKNAKHKKVFSFQDMLIEKAVSGDSPDSRLMNRELTDTIKQAVSRLNPCQRQAISLRCFENMSFREIGSVLEISEVSARVNFHRGLQAVRRSLKKQGFTSSSLVLALIFFGKVTAQTQAAASTIAVSEQIITGAGSGLPIVNTITRYYAYISANIGKITATAVAITALSVGLIDLLMGRHNVSSIHYTLLGLELIDDGTPIPLAGLDPQTSLPINMDDVQTNLRYKSHGLYEHKIFFPDGPDGAMIRFMHRKDMAGTNLCQWLQDGSGYYYYESGTDTLFITNDPLRMFILPTDLPQVAAFMDTCVGLDRRVTTKRSFFDECLYFRNDNRAEDYHNIQTRFSYNDLSRDSISADWPKSFSHTVDKRDQMHKRGWTYYQISGEFFGKPVSGQGRVPFVYNQYQPCQPWLYLEIGDDKLIDYTDGHPSELIIDGKSTFYPDNSLYTCLPRQWMGFAFIDSLVRDAAACQIYFEIKLDIDTDGKVILYPFGRFQTPTLIFDINRYDDLIRSIEARVGDRSYGKINFHYLQNIEGKEKLFTHPEPTLNQNITTQPPTTYWLKQLINK